MLKQGLYEQVVNTEIKDELRQLPEDSKHVEKIDTAESSSVLTQYLSEVVHKGLDRIAGDDISAQLNLVNKIVDLISQETAQDDLRDFTVDDEGEQLFALLSRDDPMMRIGRKKAKDLPRPETSIAQSSLFTGAVHEPQMFSELKKEIASADLTLVRVSSPTSDAPTTGYDENMQVPADYEYIPRSLQYRPYTADNMYVRFESIGGQITVEEYQGIYGTEYDYVKENRSYFGKTGTVKNESDLDFVEEIAERVDNLVLVMNLNSSMVWSEIEPLADAILVSFGGGRTHSAADDILYEIIAGNHEPSALLPMQQPLDMETVEAQYEDVPRDMECYVDANGNTYDFTFGLNWSGVINDERVAKYNVDPIVGTDPMA